MIIKAVKLYENGFMTQPFAFGGEEGMAQFDPSGAQNISCRQSSTNVKNGAVLCAVFLLNSLDYLSPWPLAEV